MLCVGLDSDIAVLERSSFYGDLSRSPLGVQAAFNVAIIDATHDIVAAYKPNSAFYEARGANGISELRETIAYIRSVSPATPIILDAKRADIGNTNLGYVAYAFEYLKADAITVHPYLGMEALEPFLRCDDKGIFVLCRTSNPGAGEFQDVRHPDDRPVYEIVAQAVQEQWAERGNCGLVVGSTYTDELAEVRRLAPTVPILVPGVGAQGGDLVQSVKVGATVGGGGLFLNASRSVLFGADSTLFAEAARAEAMQLDDAIRRAVVRS